MSRVMGRMFDVYEISKLIKEANIKKYKSDNTKTTWDSLIDSKEKYRMYIPSSAIEYLKTKEIKFSKGCYNLQFDFEIKKQVIVKFPSLTAREEYKKGFAFMIGFILNNCHNDIEGDYLTYTYEYNEVLPLLMEYLYDKEIGKEDNFMKKYLYLLKMVAASFVNDYKNYTNFENYRRSLNFSDLRDDEYEIIMSYSRENDEKMECAVSEALVQLASYDGTLEIIEKFKTREELKNVIELLFLNEKNDRSGLLHDIGINSFGFKTLRKQLKKC